MQKELSSEIKKIKAWANKHKVVDVILFGSAARGKTKPNDVDLCILIKDSDEKKSIDLVDSLGKITDKSKYRFQINILTTSTLSTGASLSKTLLTEGISLTKNKKISALFGFQNKSIFTYTLNKFTPSRRVQFHYLLQGRYSATGILKEVQGRFLGNGVIEVPTENEDTLKEIFNSWKIEHKIQRGLIS